MYQFKQKSKDNLKRFALVVGGSALFAASVNLFVVPLGLYNPGCTGVAQLIRSIFISYFGLHFSFDVAGIINALLNIPLTILAYKKLSHKFFVGTLLSVIVQTAAFSFVAIPSTPLVADIAINCIIGATLAATGIGLTLTAGYSGGGTDILGVYLAQKRAGYSVGKLTLLVNCFIYFTSAILFSPQTALYSIFYAVVFSFFLDKLHLQNREICCIIFTRNPNIRPLIVNELHRGLTWWNGMGGWSDAPVEVLISVVSKKELPELSRKVHDADPSAFIIRAEGTNVIGNFEKRLIA
ncbi:MAG: YitT family protein [Atopobium sp.]|nr:YitT family protein [Atopobium sp.]